MQDTNLFPGSARSRILARTLPLLVASFASVAPAQALVINEIFDSSITSLSNAATVENAFITAASVYSNAFSDPVTVNIQVSWGKVGSYALPSNAVGASLDNLYGYFTYSQIRSYLTNAASTADDKSAVANLPKSAPSGVSRYVLPFAEAKALGLVAGNSTTIDGYIGFAGNSSTGYTYDSTGTVAAGTFDFNAVAQHEIDEVLGGISGLQSGGSTFRTPLDLFRYSAPGAIGFSYTAPAYFSVDGGKTDLHNFNNSSSGGDRADWLTTSTSADSKDAFISPGQHKTVSAVDLERLDVLGWDSLGSGALTNGVLAGTAHFDSVDPGELPEPATALLLAPAFLLLLRRRR